MQQDILIQLATMNDLDAIEKVGDKLFDHAIKKERAIEFIEDPRHHLVLAYFDAEVIGMASGFHYVHPDKDPSLFMNEVGVQEAFQNRGIGRSLVKYLWEHAKTLGCKEAWICTDESNVAALKCYREAGGKRDDKTFIVLDFNDNTGKYP